MHTNTSKQILTPLAEAVFSLILIIAESEISNSPIQDLTKLASAVDAQITNLVKIGEKIMGQSTSDDKLKEEMPKSCKEVSDSSATLIEGTNILRADPLSIVGRNKLLDSVKGILSGTTSILYVVDDAEVRKIINTSQLVVTKSAMIKSEPSITPQQLVQTLMVVSQTVVQLAQITNKRIGELLQQSLQTRLKLAIGEVTRESPLLITTTKVWLQNQTNQRSKESRNNSCDRLIEACREIETVIQIQSEEDLKINEMGSEGLKILYKLADEKQSKVKDALQIKETSPLLALQNVLDANKNYIDIANVILNESTDNSEKEKLLDMLGDISKDNKALHQKALEVIHRTPEANLEVLSKDIIDFENKLDNFRTEAGKETDCLPCLTKQADDLHQKIIDSTQSKNGDDFNLCLDKYNTINAAFSGIARATIEKFKDRKEKNKFLAKLSDIEACQKALNKKANESFNDAENLPLQADLFRLLNDNIKKQKEMHRGLDSNQEILAVHENLSNLQLDKLNAALHPHDGITEENLAAFKTSNKNYIAAAKGFIDNIPNVNQKKKLLDKIAENEELQQKISKQANVLLKSPKNVEAQMKLSHLLYKNSGNLNAIQEEVLSGPEALKSLLRLRNMQKQKLMKYLADKNTIAAKAALAEVEATNKAFTGLSNELATQISDASKHKAILASIAKCEESNKTLSSNVQEAIKNPSSGDKAFGNIVRNEEDLQRVADQINAGFSNLKPLLRIAKEDQFKLLSGLKLKDNLVGISEVLDYLELNRQAMENLKDISDSLNNNDKKKRLLSAITESEKAANEIIEVSAAISSNPGDVNLQENLQKLLESHRENIKKLQEEFGNDSKALDKLAKLADSKQLAILTNVNVDSEAAMLSLNDFVKYNKKYFDIARKLASNCTNPALKQLLEPKIKELENLQDNLVKQAQEAILDPDNKALQDGLLRLVDLNRSLMSSLQEELSVAFDPMDRRIALIREHGNKTKSTLENADIVGADTASAAYNTVTGQLIKRVEGILANILKKDEEGNKNDQNIKTALNKIQELNTSINGTVTLLKQDNTNGKNRQRLEKLLDMSLNNWKCVQSLINRSLVGELVELTADLVNHKKPKTIIGDLYKTGTEVKSKEQLPKCIKKYNEASDRLIEILNLTANNVPQDNPNLLSILNLQKEKLAKLKPSIVLAIQDLAANPTNTGSKEIADAVISSWEDCIKEIQNITIAQEGIFNAAEIISGTKNVFDQKLKDLDAAMASQDIQGVNKATIGILTAAHQFLDTAKKELENTDDPGYKGELTEKIGHVENSLAHFDSSLLKLVETWKATNSYPGIDAKGVHETKTELGQELESLGKVIRDHRGDISISEDAIQDIQEEEIPSPVVEAVIVPEDEEVDHDVIFIEEDQPQLLSVQEAMENPIKAFAQELKVQVSHWSTQGNPIVFAASEMSRFMEELSRFHMQLKENPTPECKKGFIQAAKDILAQANALVIPAQTLAESCSDLRLRKQLLLTLERITTLSQQLKIVAAVKASSPRDTDPDQQLIGCAQNLMVAVKTCLKECESASIRCKAVEAATGRQSKGRKSVTAGGSDLYKFKRAIYKGNSSKRLSVIQS